MTPVPSPVPLSLGALNTAINPLLVGADGFGALRIRLQSTTAVAVPATDDWQLQWEKNASGSWINASTGGTTVVGLQQPEPDRYGPTTNRLGAGTGSFVAGKVCEDGVANALGWTASNYTELVFSLTLKAADLAGGDVLRFRVLRNGVTTGMTYTQTPTINIKVPVAVAGSATGVGGASAALTVGVALPDDVRVDESGVPRITEDGQTRLLEGVMPFPMTGLAVWWDADDASSFIYSAAGGVGKWLDKSSIGSNHATGYTGSNPSGVPGSSRPTRTATINSRPAVDFAPGSVGLPYTMPDLLIPPFAATYTAAEIFLVLDLTVENDGALLGKWSPGALLSHYPAGGVIYEGWGTDTRKTVGNPTADLTAKHIYNLRTAAGLYEAAVNTEELLSTTSNTVAFRTDNYEIPFFNNPGNGYMGEVLMYDRVLSPAERTQVRDYLTAKWLVAPPVIVSVAGSASGISTAGATSLGLVVPLVASASGLATVTATTMVAARALVATTTPGTSTVTATGMIATRGLTVVGPAGAGTATANRLALAIPLNAVARAAGTSTASATTLANVVALAAASGGVSTASATTALITRGLVGATGGLSTAAATTAAVARPLAATAGGLSNTTAALAAARPLAAAASGQSTTTAALDVAGPVGVAVDLAGSAAGISTATAALARAVPLAATLLPTTTAINDTFDGTAGTLLTAYTPPYASDQFYTMMVLDGAGNATTNGAGFSGGATHTSQLPTDCWAEWVVAIPDLVEISVFSGQIKMPALRWYHGYNLQLSCSVATEELALLRDDVYDPARAVAVTLQEGVDYALRIEARGANFKLFVDGVLKLDWTDPSPLTGAGLVGPYNGMAVYTEIVPSSAIKVRSYRAGGIGVGGTATGALSVSAAPIIDLAGSSSGTSTFTCSEGGPPTLPAFTGLTVWLEADQLALADGAAVSPWPDLSGGGQDGVIVGSPAPTYRANALNGLPVVRFKLNEGRVRGDTDLASSGLPAPTYNYTVVYLARMVGPSIGRIFAGRYPVVNFLIGYHTSALASMYDGGWVSAGRAWGALPTPWQMWSATGAHNGTTYAVEFYEDGVLAGSAASGVGLGPGYNLSGYSDVGVEETCDCEVAALLIYNRPLVPAERVQVEGYLQTKYLGGGDAGPGFVVARAFIGASAGLSTTTGAAQSVERSLVASSTGISTATATTLVRSVPLAGAAAGSSTAAATTALVTRGLAATSAGTASAITSLAAARPLTAPPVTGTSTATGTLAAARPLAAASAIGGSTTTGALVATKPIAASAAGVSTATGALVVAKALVASAAGTSTTSANMVASAAGGLAAFVIGSSTASGALRVARPLVGSASGISTASATTVAKTIAVDGDGGRVEYDNSMRLQSLAPWLDQPRERQRRPVPSSGL